MTRWGICDDRSAEAVQDCRCEAGNDAGHLLKAMKSTFLKEVKEVADGAHCVRSGYVSQSAVKHTA
jgi:hypothetical protein